MTSTLTYDLIFSPLRAVVMIYSHAKVQGQWSVDSENRVKQSDGQTDGGNCITSLANAVGNGIMLLALWLCVLPFPFSIYTNYIPVYCIARTEKPEKWATKCVQKWSIAGRVYEYCSHE